MMDGGQAAWGPPNVAGLPRQQRPLNYQQVLQATQAQWNRKVNDEQRVKEKKELEINFQTSKLIMGQGWPGFIESYIIAHTKYGEDHIPSPDGVLATRTDRVTPDQEQTVQAVTALYKKELFLFNVKFLSQHGAKLFESVWMPFIAEAIIAGDISPAVAVAMGYDLAKINEQ